MGILSRFGSIMSANINNLLDKCEDPEKMIDQYLREAMDDLADVKRETAAVMAVETQTKRALDANTSEVRKWTDLATKALQSGNEDDARTLLSKKQAVETQTATLQKAYDMAHKNASDMRAMHDKLTSDVQFLKSRRESVKATMAVAKTQKTINKMGESAEKVQGSMGAFSRMEEKASKMLDTETALADLNAAPEDAATDLAAKYGSGSSASVDDELAAMKASLGL